MAVVLTSLSATLTRTVFIKPPDMVRQLTSLPRAIVNFNILNGTIDAKPVNDQQELIVGMTLPSEFAYRMLDMTVSLIQDVANDWSPRAYFELTNSIRNLEVGATERHVVIIEDLIRIPTPVEMWIARVPAWHALPRYIIQARTQTATPVITFKATNQNAAVGAAGTINFFVSYFEYDLEQVEMFPVHSPLLVFDR